MRIFLEYQQESIKKDRLALFDVTELRHQF